MRPNPAAADIAARCATPIVDRLAQLDRQTVRAPGIRRVTVALIVIETEGVLVRDEAEGQRRAS